MLRTEKIDVFYGELQALIEVSVEVREKDLVAVIGSNGAGKTTLLRTISGLNRARAGKILFQDETIHGESTDRICLRGIVQVPEGRKLFPRMTVLENLEMGAYLPGAKAMMARRLQEGFTLFPVLSERRKQYAG